MIKVRTMTGAFIFNNEAVLNRRASRKFKITLHTYSAKRDIMKLEMPMSQRLMLSHYTNNRDCQDIWTGTLTSDENKEDMVWGRLLS